MSARSGKGNKFRSSFQFSSPHAPIAPSVKRVSAMFLCVLTKPTFSIAPKLPSTRLDSVRSINGTQSPFRSTYASKE
ncbi:hypothetical protein PGT21_011873 [Puccinia graminis f. sp. tritici]|uniref:Uncharacterized protein n=1 Tax=Puccinia graminis f. sp. tritici TaxID=56615 RepID=A0A5B0QAK1_PUCGR|nr:hypothetical protein PGT21_011873 [Puccinia graminis f. sp. tritici]